MGFQEDARKAFAGAINQPVPNNLKELLEGLRGAVYEEPLKFRGAEQMVDHNKIRDQSDSLSIRVANLENKVIVQDHDLNTIRATLMINWGPDTGRTSRKTPILITGDENIHSMLHTVLEYYTNIVHGQNNNPGQSV